MTTYEDPARLASCICHVLGRDACPQHNRQAVAVLDASIARLRTALLTTADWLDAITAETEPKPSELMAMVAGLRAALGPQR